VTAAEGHALEIMMITTAGGDKTAEGQAAIAIAAEKLRRPLKRLDSHLAAHSWLVGDRFTVADINVAECLRYAQSHPTLISEFPAVTAWLAACQSRPAFQKMWAGRMAEPA
jgi:glutathione S-transferase